MPEGKRAGQTLDEKELQTLKDGTPLGYALEAAFKAASKTGGKVVVFSDGGNSCAAVDPCDVMTRYLSAYKNIELQFEPIKPEPENGDKLACRWSARQPVQNPSPLLAASWPTWWSPSAVSAGLKTNPQRGQAVLPEEKYPWLWVDLVLIVVGFLVAAVFVLGIATWRHHLIDEEKRKRNRAAKGAAAAIADEPDPASVTTATTKGGDGSTQDEVDPRKGDVWKIPKSPIFILIGVLLASLLASATFFPGSLEQGAGGLWWFAGVALVQSFSRQCSLDLWVGHSSSFGTCICFVETRCQKNTERRRRRRRKRFVTTRNASGNHRGEKTCWN